MKKKKIMFKNLFLILKFGLEINFLLKKNANKGKKFKMFSKIQQYKKTQENLKSNQMERKL